ncbi:hypothetical protein, partial [Klebsiella pneumoniae]
FFYAPARGFWRLSGFMKLPGFYPSDVPAVGPSLVLARIPCDVRTRFSLIHKNPQMNKQGI